MAKGKHGWIKWLVVAIIVVGVAAWGLDAMQKGAPVLVSKAGKGEVRAWVEDRAKTSLERVYKLSMPVDGRFMPIEMLVGTRVRQGQLLASLDDAPLLAARAQAQASLSQNEFNALEETALAEFKRWIEALAKTAQAAWEMTEASRAQLKFSDWYTESLSVLVEKGAVAKEQALRAKADNAQSRVNAAVSKLVAEIADTVTIITELGPKYVAEWLKRKGMENEALSRALDKAEDDLKRARITSPIDGIILARHVKNETMLPAGAPLLDIGDLDKLQITADILTQSAGPIRPGQEVDILDQLFGAEPAKGRVARIEPEAFTKVSSLGVEQQRVPVVIDFDEKSRAVKSLGLGYRLRVRIYTDEAKEAVTAPRLAIFRDTKGDWRLFVVEKGKAKLRPVELGIMNDETVQVTKGLTPGEMVIVSPPKALKDGDAVEAEEV